MHWFFATNPSLETPMRQRLIPNFEAEGITPDHIIDQVLKDVPRTVEAGSD